MKTKKQIESRIKALEKYTADLLKDLCSENKEYTATELLAVKAQMIVLEWILQGGNKKSKR